MKKKFLMVLIVIIPALLYSQDVGEIRSKYMQGVQALANNNLIDAESYLNEVISFPDSKGVYDRYKSKAYYFLGDVFFIKQDYVKSITYYKTVVQKFINQDIYSKTLYKLGRTLVINNRLDEGIAVLNDYIAKYDDSDKMSDNALYWIGRGYVGKCEYNAGLSLFQLILNKYPETALSYDIRSSIASLTKLIDEENKEKLRIAGITNEIQLLKQKNEQLVKGRELLEKMSHLLIIKQRLLEIKSDKIKILEKLKENREM